MTDETTTTPANDETSPPEMPPGRCAQCGASVPVKEIERHEGKPPAHRVKTARHDLVGDLCGPVITKWHYQVRYVARVLVPIPVGMEHPGALSNVESIIRAGLRPESVVVTDWTLVGTN